MSFVTGTAAGHTDLLDKIRRFAAGYGTSALTGTADGGNTGNGTMTKCEPRAAAVTETVWVKFTSATAFNVGNTEGGTEIGSGTIGGATGNTYDFNHAKIRFRLTQGGTVFATNDKFTLAVTQGATKTAGYEWVEERNGLQTTAVAYGGGAGYTVDGPDYASYPNEVVLRGEGPGGLDKVYAGYLAYAGSQSGTDFYNIVCNAYSGFSAGVSWHNQPGALTADKTDYAASATPITIGDRRPTLLLLNTTLTYWLSVTARKILVVVEVGGTAIVSAYTGLGVAYGSPGQIALPLFCGASRNTEGPEFRWTENSAKHSAFCNPTQVSTYSGAWMRTVDGVWRRVYNRNASDSLAIDDTVAKIWPWWTPVPPAAAPSGVIHLRENIDQGIPMLPATVAYQFLGNASGLGNGAGSGAFYGSIYFELEGVFAVPGYVQSTPISNKSEIGSPATHYIFTSGHSAAPEKLFCIAAS